MSGAARQVGGRGGEWPWLTGAWLLATVAFTLVPGLSEWGEWSRRDGVGGGSAAGVASFALRLIALCTCHFSHYGAGHLASNALALLLTGVVIERSGAVTATTAATAARAAKVADRRALLVATVLAMPAIPLAIALLAPEMSHYRGASGIASAWFVVALFATWRRHADRPTRGLVVFAAVVFAAKLASEVGIDRSWFVPATSSGFASVPLAHVIGAVCGAIVMLFARRAQSPDRRLLVTGRSEAVTKPTI